MQSIHLPARKHIHSKSLVTIGLAVTTAFLAICGNIIWDMSRRDYEQARRSAENVLATISADINRNFELYDLSLQAVGDGLSLPDIWQVSPANRQLILFDRAATAKHLGSIFVLNENGVSVLDSRTLDPPSEDHSEREYFQIHQRHPDGQMYLSHPWTAANGDHLIGISRRLSGPDGSFMGAVVGTMNLKYFNELFRRVSLREGDSLNLLLSDGTIVMRSPLDFRDIGRSLASSPIFKRIVRDESGAFEEDGTITGDRRLLVHKRIGGSPLYLSHGLSLRSIYAAWRTEALRLGFVILLVGALNFALIIFLARALKRGSNAEHAMALSATTDSLTNLCNRRRFEELFGKEWRRAQRTQTPLAILMIDADQFKSYNDQFGHQLGDVALASIARCIEGGTRRGGDLAARYGGEEFVVLLPQADADAAFVVAESIRTNVLKLRAQQDGRADRTPTVSLGLASMIPTPVLQPTDLIKAADAALYEAKSNGRNRTERAPMLRLVGLQDATVAA